MIFLMSYACALDWRAKISLGDSWLINIIYHPVAGFLSIFFLGLASLYLIQRLAPNQIKSVEASGVLCGRGIIVIRLIAFVNTILLVINSYSLLTLDYQGSIHGSTVAIHSVLGLIAGSGAFFSKLPWILPKVTANSHQFRKYSLLSLLSISVILMGIVIIAMVTGQLALSFGP